MDQFIKFIKNQWYSPLVVALLVFIVDSLVKSFVLIINITRHFNQLYPEGYKLSIKGTKVYVNEILFQNDVFSFVNSGLVILLAIILILAFLFWMTKIFFGIGYLSFKKPKWKPTYMWLGIFAFYFTTYLVLANKFDQLKSNFITKDTFEFNSFWVMILLIGVLIPMFEEIIFRGLVQKAISDRFGYIFGIVSASFIFTLLHGQYNLPILLFIFGLSLILGFAKHFSKSLWVPFVLHATTNTLGLLMVYLGVN